MRATVCLTPPSVITECNVSLVAMTVDPLKPDVGQVITECVIDQDAGITATGIVSYYYIALEYNKKTNT